MSSAPLREVAPRATLHRPSLSRAQIQVRAISEQPFDRGLKKQKQNTPDIKLQCRHPHQEKGWRGCERR